jgi:hypothetical protein
LNSDPTIPSNENDPLIVIGMGRTEEGGNSSTTLMSTEIYEIDTEECHELYPEFPVNDKVVLCAAGEGKDRYVHNSSHWKKSKFENNFSHTNPRENIAAAMATVLLLCFRRTKL